MELSTEEKYIRTELEKIYPQLVINSRKTCGAGYERHGGDLLALCIQIFFEKPLDYQLNVVNDGKLENFITKLMGFQLKLGTTRYYHHYRKHNEKMREFYPDKSYYGLNTDYQRPFQDEEDIVYTCMKEYIDKLNPYEKMVVEEIIINKEKYVNVSKKYNINYTTLVKDFKRLKKEIKQACQHLR